MNIYPREIEQVLELHPMVLEAAAFPMLIRGNDSAPFAVVCVLGQVSEAELLKMCFAQLGWRRPQRIFFTPEMPRNASGKILKRELAKKVAAMLGATKGHIPAQGGTISTEE